MYSQFVYEAQCYGVSFGCLVSQDSAHSLFVKHHVTVFLLDNLVGQDSARNLFVKSFH